MATEEHAREDPLMVASTAIAKPVRAFGGFYAMALDTFVLMFKPPFAWREFISQAWFVARVSLLPTLMLTIPYTVLLTFIENILLTEIGAADFSGTGAALGIGEADRAGRDGVGGRRCWRHRHVCRSGCADDS